MSFAQIPAWKKHLTKAEDAEVRALLKKIATGKEAVQESQDKLTRIRKRATKRMEREAGE